MVGEPPVTTIWRRLEVMREAIESCDWDAAADLADEIVKLIRLALDPIASKTSKPHLEGVFVIGTMSYERAPIRAKKAINKMNRIIRSANRAMK